LSDVPPDHPSAPLPEPICPQGAPPVPAGEPAQAPPPAPGESALDRLIADQPEDHDAAQGHKQEEEQDDEGPEGGLS